MPPSNLDVTCIPYNVVVKSTSMSMLPVNSGVGLFASRELSVGDHVLETSGPMCAALDGTALQSRCYECFRGVEDEEGGVEGVLGFADVSKDGPGIQSLKSCAGCKVARYCSKACQKISWSAHHSLECPIFKQVHPQVIPGHLRAVLRLLLLRRARRVKDEDWASLLACSTHVKEFNQDGQKGQLSSFVQLTKMLNYWTQGAFADNLILELLMRLKINSLTLQTPFCDPLGVALHPLFAKVNHDCDPSCYVRFPGPDSSAIGISSFNSSTIILTPLRQVMTNEEITISYVDETMPVRYRKQELKERYFFVCNCARCSKDEKIDAQLGRETHVKVHKLQDQAKKILDTADTDDSSSPQTRAKLITSHIRTLFAHDSAWPVTLYPFPQLLHQLILCHIDTQDFVSAFGLAALLHFNVDPSLYSSPAHPLLLTHLLLLIKLMGAVFDVVQQSLASSTNDSQALILLRRLDLDLWHRALSERMVVQASKTWKEQSWSRMNDVLVQQRSYAGINSNSIAEVSKRERERMNLLCKHTLDTLKQN